MSCATYECEFCGLHYFDEDTAQSCLNWCVEHNSCNLEITATSVERTHKADDDNRNFSAATTELNQIE